MFSPHRLNYFIDTIIFYVGISIHLFRFHMGLIIFLVDNGSLCINSLTNLSFVPCCTVAAEGKSKKKVVCGVPSGLSARVLTDLSRVSSM